MSINNYWSKKSPEIANGIFKSNLRKNNIILEPFLGSGTSLEGIRRLNFKVKFVGVELNQMPLEYAKFNANPPQLNELLNVRKKILTFYQQNENLYEYPHPNYNTNCQLDRIVLDIDKNKINIKSFLLHDGNKKKIILNKNKNLKNFEKCKNIYLERNKETKKKIKRDLLLDENSRIAIKSKMYISDLYSPISFYILSKICDEFVKDKLLKTIISSVIHLAKYTDLRSQSQFPFWYPKTDAIDRNVLLLILKKINFLIKNYPNKLEEIKEFHDFKSLKNSGEKSFILINKPIQKINSEIPDNSIDLVFSDPPYFDQVAYSEYLTIWEFFLGYKKNIVDELVQTNRKKKIKDKNQYLKDLHKCFQVITKKMKKNSQAIIYFKDSKLSNVYDFLRILANNGLNFEKQLHVTKKKYTYKQNTTKETTVVGDCLFFFKKEDKKINLIEREFDLKKVEKIILEFTYKYLKKKNNVKVSEILDNGLIKVLFLNGYLKYFKDSNSIINVLKKKYLIDKKNRNLVEKKK